MSNHPPTFILAGFAKLPAKVPGDLTLELEVDPYDMRIVDAACSCLPALGQKLLVGTRLDDLEGAIGQIRARYVGATQRAMIASLEDALRRYEELRGRLTRIRR